MEYALKTKQRLQYCIFKGDDIHQYVENEVNTKCSCEDDVYEATFTGFKTKKSIPLGYEIHPFLQLDGGDVYVRCDSHFNKIFV